MNQTPLVFKGKRKNFAPGSSLLKACNNLGMKVPTNCKKGDCATCVVNIAGGREKACIGKVPPAPKLKVLLKKGLVVSR
jgi:ferredoxin